MKVSSSMADFALPHVGPLSGSGLPVGHFSLAGAQVVSDLYFFLMLRAFTNLKGKKEEKKPDLERDGTGRQFEP